MTLTQKQAKQILKNNPQIQKIMDLMKIEDEKLENITILICEYLDIPYTDNDWGNIGTMQEGVFTETAQGIFEILKNNLNK